MPITQSAKKALRVSEKKRAHNIVLENKFKKILKGAKKENLSEVCSVIDKTAKNHIISKGKAARLKSRLTRKLGKGEVAPKIKKPKVQSKKLKSILKSK